MFEKHLKMVREEPRGKLRRELRADGTPTAKNVHQMEKKAMGWVLSSESGDPGVVGGPGRSTGFYSVTWSHRSAAPSRDRQERP